MSEIEEQELRSFYSRLEKLEYHQDNLEKELKHHEIAFAKNDVYVKEIYKQMTTIAGAVESLRDPASRIGEDFADDVYDAGIAAKDAVNVAAEAAKQAVNAATSTVKEAINLGESKWKKYFENAFWLVLGSVVAFVASKIHF